MTQHLEPANSIIERFGGLAVVMEITGISRTCVYRWTQPKEKGGTDGFIPTPHARKLLRHARQNDIPVTAEQFLDVENTVPSVGAPDRAAAE